MPLRLIRIDERLLHGQVLVGWGGRFGLEHYVVVDDDLAASDWEQELYTSALDEETVEFTSADDAIGRFGEWVEGEVEAAILTRGVDAMARLAEAGVLADHPVNLGGLHPAPGRRRLLPYVYADDRMIEQLSTIERLSGGVEARDLPGAFSVTWHDLRGGKA